MDETNTVSKLMNHFLSQHCCFLHASTDLKTMFSCYFGDFCFMKFLPVDVSHCCSKGSITFIIFFPFGSIFSYWILQISVQLLFWKLRDKHCIKSCQLHTPVEFSIASLET